MNKFQTVGDIPEIPIAKTKKEHKALCKELIECGAIPKKNLKIGVTYAGSCRNAEEAVWNGTEFEYQRSKWGETFIDAVPHFEDERYYDVFIPIYRISKINLDSKMSKHYFRHFTKKDRSSFSYWYYHWKAYNLTAYYLGCWKFKYLFHDFEKPWLRLFLPYKKVQEIHRKNNKHHLEYKRGLDKVDIQAFIIDNECCRFTKINAPLTAREYLDVLVSKQMVSSEFADKCYIILNKLNL
jgi:hypothetical protein